MASLVPDFPSAKGVQHWQKREAEGYSLHLDIVKCWKQKTAYICCVFCNAIATYTCIVHVRYILYHNNHVFQASCPVAHGKVMGHGVFLFNLQPPLHQCNSVHIHLLVGYSQRCQACKHLSG